MVEECHTEALDRLHALVLPEAGSRVTCEVVSGEPVRAIVQAAGRHQADLLVMGQGGRYGWRGLFRPSVTEQVTRRAPVRFWLLLDRPATNW